MVIEMQYAALFKESKTLGTGAEGQVVLCQNLRTNELVAVKRMKSKSEYVEQMWCMTIFQIAFYYPKYKQTRLLITLI